MLLAWAPGEGPRVERLMAIVQFGGIVGAASGQLGGVTFVPGRASTVARGNTRRGTQSSVRQVFRRSQFAYLTAFWQLSSDLERGAWIAYGLDPGNWVTNRLGIAVRISGYAWFKRYNVDRLVRGYAATIVVPAAAASPAPTLLTFSFTHYGPSLWEATVTFGAGTFTGERWLGRGAFTKSQGQQRNYNAMKFLGAGAGFGGSSLNFQAAWRLYHGTPIDGAKATLTMSRMKSNGPKSGDGVITAVVTKTY